MFTKWLKVGMSDMQEWTEEVLEPNKTLFLCFSLCMFKFLWQGQKAALTIVEFEIFDIFYSKLQLVSTFSICSKFCVENWLLCCNLICKRVTCRSGCKRFWKSALHISKLQMLSKKKKGLIFPDLLSELNPRFQNHTVCRVELGCNFWVILPMQPY